MFYHGNYTNPGHGAGARMAANNASRVARNAQSEIYSLSDEVERLMMISEALWEMLKEKNGYTDDDLMRRVAAIDMKDGKLDGKVAKSTPAECPKCKRVLNRRHTACIYCGEPVVQHPFRR